MKITNKDLIQSYIVTTARYDFSVYEKRILYRIVEMQQNLIEGKKLDRKYNIQNEVFGDKEVTMPISSFLNHEEDKNYDRVKKALIDLEGKKFEYEDDKSWELIRIIQSPKIDKYGSSVTFRLQSRIYDALMDFSKGFKKFELQTAMEFESHYSMRFYELLSGQKTPISYSISSLKIMFKLEGKYDRVNDFIKRVIDPAKKELDKKSPYSFEYKPQKKGRKTTSILFYPVYNPENRDPNLERKKLQKQVSLNWDLDNIIINYLKQNFLFSTDEIKNNIDLFKTANLKLDLVYELSVLRSKCENKANPKGYLINTIKKMLEKII